VEACEIGDGMEGANREHMFALPGIERTTGKQIKLPSEKLKTNTWKYFLALNLWNSLPQSIADGEWVQRRTRQING